MARPTKNTVEYFPHFCQHGQTMFILEQRWGNDGYAFWFKLLEMLGSTENHFIDLRNIATKEFLSAKTHLGSEQCNEMLDLLADLDAIDPDLWSQKKVVWCDKLVSNFDGVYKKRRTDLPEKPELRSRKEHLSKVSGEKTPQSKVKESKVKESRVEESRNASPPEQDDHAVTVFEREILSTLKGIKGYSFCYSKDLEFLRKIIVDFPQVDIHEEIKKWETWLFDHPLKKTSNPRSQIRNWLKNAVRFSANKEKNGIGQVDRRKLSFEDYMKESLDNAPE